MSINADSIIDRIYLKAQISKWRILAIIFAVIAMLVVVGRAVPNDITKSDYVARVSFNGIIGDDQRIYDLIDSVEKDDKAKAVIIWIDSPGGSAVAGEEIYLRLRKLSEKKPVVSVMRSVAASAGFLVSLGGDQSFARAGTITGSIGVLMESAEVTELIEKLGIKPISIKSSPLKASPSPFEKSTPEAEKVIRDMIMDFYKRFVDITAERRNLPRERVVVLADGRVYSGTQAVEYKLADAIGGEKEAREWLAKNKNISEDIEISDVEIKKENQVLDRFLEGAIGKFWEKSRVGLDGIAAIWHH